MIKRKIQVITSKFGWRKLKGKPNFHRGIDLRSWTDKKDKKLPVVFPEDCEFIRRKWQKKWGWTLIFKPTENGTAGYCEFKFTHIANDDKFIVGKVYKKGTILSHTARTDYMKKKGFGDHLHFATLRWGRIFKKEIKIIKRSVDPEIYYGIRDIPVRVK